MFAKSDDNYLSLDKKYFCEIFSIISFIFSAFILFVSYKKVKMTITNNLIMQIIMAEILDGINIFLAIAIDAYGEFTFENYASRMGFCLTQIYLGVFSCLWNLFSSLFISIRLYDRMQNKNKIFKNKFMYEYATTMSYGIPSIISYILWTSQVLFQSNTLQNKTYRDYYQSKSNTNFFRYMYCWVSGANNTVLFVISFLLIAANFYFSIFKSFFFIRKITKDIEEADEGGNTSQRRVKKIKNIMYSLIFYPLVSGFVWIIYFVLQILTGYINGKDKIESLAKSMKEGAGAWCIIIIIVIRQISFTLVFFLTQPNLKRHTWNYLTFKYCKKGKTESTSTTSDKKESNRLLDEKNEDND